LVDKTKKLPFPLIEYFKGSEESVKVLLLGLKVIGMIISIVSILWGLLILIMYHTNGTKLALQVIVYSLIAIIAFVISIKSKKIVSAITVFNRNDCCFSNIYSFYYTSLWAPVLVKHYMQILEKLDQGELNIQKLVNGQSQMEKLQTSMARDIRAILSAQGVGHFNSYL